MTRRLPTVVASLVALTVAACSSDADETATGDDALTSDAISITRNPDGTFHVVCDARDGSSYVEARTGADLDAGRVCVRTGPSTPFRVVESTSSLDLYVGDRRIVTWRNPKSFVLEKDYALLVDASDTAGVFKPDGSRTVTWQNLKEQEARPSYLVLRDKSDFSVVFGLDGARLAQWNSTKSWVAKDRYVVLTDKTDFSRVVRADGRALADWNSTTQVRAADKYVALTDKTSFTRVIGIETGNRLADWNSTRDVAIGEEGFALLDTTQFMRAIRVDGVVLREASGVTAIEVVKNTLRYSANGGDHFVEF